MHASADNTTYQNYRAQILRSMVLNSSWEQQYDNIKILDSHLKRSTTATLKYFGGDGNISEAMESTLVLLANFRFIYKTDGSCERAVVTTTAMLAPDVSFGHSEQDQHTTKLSDRTSRFRNDLYSSPLKYSKWQSFFRIDIRVKKRRWNFDSNHLIKSFGGK